MDFRLWLMLVTCAGLLGLGSVSILRIRASSLAAPLGILCMLGFVWRFATWTHALSGAQGWPYFTRACLPWMSAVGLRFVLTFLGVRRHWQLALGGSYALAAGLSGLAVAGLAWEGARAAASSHVWDYALGAQILSATCVSGLLLTRHLRAQNSPEEAMRTRLMLAATVVVALLTVLAPLVPEAQLLHAALMAIELLLLTTVSFGFRLFDSALTGLGAIYIVAVVAIAVGGSMFAYHVLTASWGMVALASTAIGACSVALVVETSKAILQHHAKVAHLTALGRWSAYMAHDFKNPLAAVKGAAQFLLEERAQGRSIDEQQEFLALLVSESDRLARLVDRYQHFGTQGAIREAASINELAGKVLEQQRAALPASVAVQVAFQDTLPECALDRQLVQVALENLLRNAAEAMPDGGSLQVCTSAEPGRAGAEVTLSVRDTGRGMNPRELELAFGEFFSTKRDGRGLGLPFVKRVMDAHGGTIQVVSRLGQGTDVKLSFPIA